MSELTHDQARQYIEAAAENRLGAHERSELDRHLSACAECRSFASELGEVNRSLGSAFHARWDAVPIPAAQPRRILTRVRRARTQRVLWTAGQLLAGAAALFVFIFAMDNLIGPNRNHAPTQPATLQANLALPLVRTPGTTPLVRTPGTTPLINTPGPTPPVSTPGTLPLVRTPGPTPLVNTPGTTQTPQTAADLFQATTGAAPMAQARPSIHGKVVNGYGDHAPAANIPLAIDQTGSAFTPIATTDAQGNFTLSSLPLGKHNLQSTWFSVPFTLSSPDEDIDLGVIKYPLVHPPLFLAQKASADPGLLALRTQGTVLPFQVVFGDPAWKRPGENEQRDQVWSHAPFADHGQIFFDWWFKQPALLYDTLDLFTNGTPGGPDLGPTGADWRMLAGLWNTTDFLADPGSYSPAVLNDLLQRKQLDVWLMGYQVDEVRQLGDHYLVAVHPAAGLQVIRFQGNQAALAIHVVDGDQEIIRLPKSCRNERDVDCGSEGS